MRITNEDRTNNILVDKYKAGQLNESGQHELAKLFNQYGSELQIVYGYSDQQAAIAIQSLIKGEAFVASAANAKAYNEALSYMKTYSAHSGQAALGTDALMVLPGVPGALVRSTVIAGGSYQTGTGIGQILDRNYSEGGINFGLGTYAIFGGIVGQSSLSKTGGAISSPANPGMWQTRSIGNVITKSEASLKGPVTKIESGMTKENIRSLNREN